MKLEERGDIFTKSSATGKARVSRAYSIIKQYNFFITILFILKIAKKIMVKVCLF